MATRNRDSRNFANLADRRWSHGGGSGEDIRAGGDGGNGRAVFSSLRVKAQHTVGNRNPVGDVWEEERSHAPHNGKTEGVSLGNREGPTPNLTTTTPTGHKSSRWRIGKLRLSIPKTTPYRFGGQNPVPVRSDRQFSTVHRFTADFSKSDSQT
ncbi:hypothetical protein PIB30_071115 [Stylosanthes scabra]|uniref:Uncharacterized protein n=1 Tax=Stylosanthes scabra TaxID=79078 RepID=A0ABU6TNC4_9FABA|nr:hypothetical protein [Stylosanthes scabra]